MPDHATEPPGLNRNNTVVVRPRPEVYTSREMADLLGFGVYRHPTQGLANAERGGWLRPSVRPRAGRGRRGPLYSPLDLFAARAALAALPLRDGHAEGPRPLNPVRALAADAVRSHPDRRWLVVVVAKGVAFTTADVGADVAVLSAMYADVVTVVDLDPLR